MLFEVFLIDVSRVFGIIFLFFGEESSFFVFFIVRYFLWILRLNVFILNKIICVSVKIDKIFFGVFFYWEMIL